MAMATFFAFAATLAQTAVSSEFSYKHIGGEPSEFSEHAVPSVLQAAVHGQHALYKVQFDDGEWSEDIIVDSAQDFSITLFTRVPAVSISLTDPSGNKVHTDAHKSTVSVPLDDAAPQEKGTMWTFSNPTCGTYRLTLHASSVADVFTQRNMSTARLRRKGYGMKAPDAFLFLYNDSPMQLMTHALVQKTVVGQNIGLSARIFDSVAHNFDSYVQNEQKPPASDDIQSAALHITTPSGKEIVVKMNDAGLDGDEVAKDKDYAGSIKATEVGKYMLQVVAFGTNGKESKFTRSLEHVTVVEEPMVALTNTADAVLDPATSRMHVAVHVSTLPCAATNKFLPYFQLWGKNSKGHDVAVGYFEGIAHVETTAEGAAAVVVEVDLHWLARVGVSPRYGKLLLKDVHIMDASTFILLTDSSASITVDVQGMSSTSSNTSATLAADIDMHISAILARGYNGEITRVMREGVPPAKFDTNSTDNAKRASNVLLLHGFCADKNPFEENSQEWTDGVFYSAVREGDNKGAGLTEYAENVLRFADRQGLGAYSMVGFSQGGMETLTLITYYNSGADLVSGGRVVQSVSTPYGGVSAIDSLGGLATLFGDCDSPDHLSLTQAGNWLSSIPDAKQAQTNVYRTQFGPALFGGMCNGWMNLVLGKPNDGVVEVKYTGVPHGNVFDVTEKQCHGEEMEWPAAYFDSGRNNIMNAQAAR